MEKIWIDATEFEDFGGFILETQFVREMGQAYLMADGTGAPVAPASTHFSVKNDGMYRFFIRTKNWCVGHNPDSLIIEVDGVRSNHLCSAMHVNGWYFEIGADFALSVGEHHLKLSDTSGWFGRFACVIITDDYDFTPSRELSMLKKQRREIKGIQKSVTDMGHYDLIVAGAGVGGVVAAITAARYGLKTALIHDRPVLGGNGSDEAKVALEGSVHLGHHETGVILEIKNECESKHLSWSATFAEFTAREKNLDVFANMLITNAKTENGAISEVFAVQTINQSEFRFSADLFVDGTGDGWLGYYAGAAYRVGREAKFQHNESCAPNAADGNTMSGCATRAFSDVAGTVCGYLAEDAGKPTEFKAPVWAFRLPEGDNLGRTPKEIDRGAWWLELPNDYDDVFESEFVRDSMIRMAVGYFDWLKNSWSEKEKASHYRLRALGTYLAKRESRRLIGDCILTENHYKEGQTYFDSVCYCGWKIDVHHVDGIFSGKGGRFTLNRPIPLTPVPFGALYSKNIKNLMMIGRCISVTHIGLGPVRVMLTGGTMGQAVSTAAYLCKKYHAFPREIRNAHIDELQQLLLKDGLSIPGVSHHDGKDLARSASISADSHTKNGVPSNVINGKTQKSDGEQYAWISEQAAPQSITLAFDTEKEIRQIRLTFDFPFEQYRYGLHPSPVPTELVTDFSVSLLTNGEWKTVRTVRDNVQRLAVIDLLPTVVKSVKITVTKTRASQRVIIPEIRIY